MNYTKPRIYLSPSLRDKHGSYKPQRGERVRVIWMHYHPVKDKRVEVKRSLGIEQFDTLADKKRFAKSLCKSYVNLLAKGYDPFQTEPQEQDSQTLLSALQLALDTTETTVVKSTHAGYKQAFKKFEAWAKTTIHHHALISAPDLGKIMDRYYLHLRTTANTNNTSYNNLRASMSALFSQLINNRTITFNPITAVHKQKADPKKNKPFTDTEIERNTEWLQENDPALQFYLQVITYSFLRNNEVIRVKVGDIDMQRGVIKIKTKSQRTELVPIISQLHELLEKHNIASYPANYSLIHYSGEPAYWDATPEHKMRLFGKRFRKLRLALGYDSDYKVYSYRHVATMHVFKSFEAENLTQEETILKTKAITRHKSIAGIKNYLRDIGAFVHGDYGNRINLKL